MLDGETVVEYSAVAETNISAGLNATSSLKPAIHMTKMDTTFAQSVWECWIDSKHDIAPSCMVERDVRSLGAELYIFQSLNPEAPFKGQTQGPKTITLTLKP